MEVFFVPGAKFLNETGLNEYADVQLWVYTKVNYLEFYTSNVANIYIGKPILL